MADFRSTNEMLGQHFIVQMQEREPEVRVVMQNGPRSTAAFDGARDEWVRYNFFPIEDRTAAIGRGLFRGLALVDIQVFTPLGRGTGASQRISRSIQRAFRDEPIAGVVVGPISWGATGETDGWYQTQVRVRVTVDEPA